jgi:multidrug efflux pump subunit AcrB
MTIESNINAVQSESEKVVTGGYKDLVQQLLVDIGEDINKSTFIVRYKPFENTRNKEIGEKFAELRDEFQKINDATYDLMDIFSQNMYFDLGFHGSSSIKKVLPIMVPGMKYDDLAVKN